MKSYTTGQVAKMLGVGRDTIHRWLRSDKIPGGRETQIGTLLLRLWTERDIAAIRKYMKQNPYKSRGRKKGKKSKP